MISLPSVLQNIDMVLFIYYISYATAWERNDIQKIIMLLYLLTDTNHKKKNNVQSTFILNLIMIIRSLIKQRKLFEFTNQINIATNKRINYFKFRTYDQTKYIITKKNHYFYFRTYNVILVFAIFSDYLSYDQTKNIKLLPQKKVLLF